MAIYKDTCATKDMADSNFIANHATLGNYVHEKEITLLDYNIGMARTEMTELFPLGRVIALVHYSASLLIYL